MSGINEFLEALKMRESGGRYDVVNSYGFVGAYQFGEAALTDLKAVAKDGNAYDNNFSGGWTGKYGVTSLEAFLASPAAQDQAALDWMQILWGYIEYFDLAKYAGTVCGGILLTPSGMIAGAHLMGVGGLSDWIQSGGTLKLCDQYGTPISEYIQTFGGYDIPWAPMDQAPASADGAILGTAGADSLAGTLGADTIRAGDGNDSVALDAGDDTLDGGAGTDWLVGGPTAMTVDLANAGAQATGYGTDRITGFENARGGAAADRLSGTEGANVLEGMGGNDTLVGRGGADRLVGGAGTDRLFGGADLAEDTFVFAAVSDSVVGSKRDVVIDFVSGVDTIDLSQIDASARLAGDQAFAFSGSTAAANAVWIVYARGDAFVRGDVNGDRIADFEIRVANVARLGADDFLL